MTPSKIILLAFFVSTPSMIAAAYVVYKAREILWSSYGIQISDNSFAFVVFLTIGAAMHLSSRRIYREISGKPKNPS